MITCLFFHLLSLAQAFDLPPWVDRTPPADPKYRYYVGRAVGESVETQGYYDATRDAMEAAIRENFGVMTSIRVTDVESARDHALDRRTEEASSKVHLDEFEQVDSHVKRTDGQVSVYLLYRYSRTAIQRERERLAAGGSELPTIPLSESGQLSLGTALRIQSEPGGAEVFVDDIRWGITPTVIRGALRPGLHQVSLRHPKQEDVTESVILPPSGEVKFFKILSPAMVALNIETEPSGAQIVMNGVRQGKSPVRITSARVGRKIFIEAIFDDRNTLTRTLELQKGVEQTVRLELQLKPEPPQGHTFNDSVNRLLDLGGGGAEHPAWLVGFNFEYTGGNIPDPYNQAMVTFGLSVERRLWSHLGIRGKVGIDSGSGRASESQPGVVTTAEGYSHGLGLPIYLSDSSSSFYVMPEVGRIMYSATALNSLPLQDTKVKFDYGRSGVVIGLQDYRSHFDLYLGFYKYNYGVLGNSQATSIGVSWIFGN